jgi:hypothetical protein
MLPDFPPGFNPAAKFIFFVGLFQQGMIPLRNPLADAWPFGFERNKNVRVGRSTPRTAEKRMRPGRSAKRCPGKRFPSAGDGGS